MDRETRDRRIAELEEKIRLGNDFEDWYKLECTQTVLEFLQKKAEKAIQELIVADPSDREKIAAAQNEHRMFHELRAVVAAYRMDAKNATETMFQMDQNVPDY